MRFKDDPNVPWWQRLLGFPEARGEWKGKGASLVLTV
jgi:hypothetical protein